MWDDRWQLVSRDTEDVFGTLRGDATWLSTVELPDFFGNGLEYESCLFTTDGSEVIRRYKSKEEAMRGHAFLTKKYNLR